MKKLFSLLIFFIAFSINAQIITNVDKLRINEITEMQEAGKVLVIDSNNLVQWVSEDKITPDLSDYYTKIDVDAILEDYYDKEEVDLLLSDIDLSDYYTKSEVDNLLSNLPTGTPSLADVLGEGNSADNNKISDLADGVDGGDAVNKAQLDALESPFEVIDVTQQALSDIAIVVKDFDNIANGMTYQEGAIDFGVSRDSIHEMGLYSFKTGVNTTASGAASSAFGVNTTASGEGSTAFGSNTIASGDYSFAFGSNTIASFYTTASGIFSSAFGDIATASGDYSSAFGYNTTASGIFSFAFGSNTTASGDYSSAFGYQTTASGGGSSAFGYNTSASGDYSSAFGYQTTASGEGSSAFGYYTEANGYASLAIGRYSTDGTAEGAWQSGSPIFKVGNGTNLSNRKNAYTLYNDGRSEQEKDMEVTTIGQGFVLKSPDGTRWRITVDNNGDLSAEQL